ncbi:hypothetical protein CEXT_711661 [Caerostris extrusa]|uniref:Uncharacterized protein n=1 Tax=Caerostris extrusa TaxID=172846 RepID=A0AAV4W8W5_CAEEX|nr:hypothetical protein CEXT_711661 [Caerostris extrusa]
MEWLTPDEPVEKMDLRTSKVQREHSHTNNKCYPKQRSDAEQNYSRWNMEQDLPCIAEEPIKEALPKTTEN